VAISSFSFLLTALVMNGSPFGVHSEIRLGNVVHFYLRYGVFLALSTGWKNLYLIIFKKTKENNRLCRNKLFCVYKLC